MECLYSMAYFSSSSSIIRDSASNVSHFPRVTIPTPSKLSSEGAKQSDSKTDRTEGEKF